jgi:hypothetical protein
MDKNKRKSQHDPLRVIAVKDTAIVFGCTETYVRAIINKTAVNGKADEILRFYNMKYSMYRKLSESELIK